MSSCAWGLTGRKDIVENGQTHSECIAEQGPCLLEASIAETQTRPNSYFIKGRDSCKKIVLEGFSLHLSLLS